MPDADTPIRFVYAKRQLVDDRGEWFRLPVAYTPDSPDKMYRSIAYQLADGSPDEDAYDLGHALYEETPSLVEDADVGEDDWFDVAHADSGFGEVRVEFEQYSGHIFSF